MDSYKQHFYNRNPPARKVEDSSAVMSPRTRTIYNSDETPSVRPSVWAGLTSERASSGVHARLSGGSLKIQASGFHLSGKGALFMEGIFDQAINDQVQAD